MPSVNCPEVEKCLEIIHLVLDGEASPAQQEYLSAHLEMCLQCLDNFQLEKELRSALQKQKMAREVPADLVNSIKRQIKEGT